MAVLAACGQQAESPSSSAEPTPSPEPTASPSPTEDAPPTADELTRSVVQVQLLVGGEVESWGSGTVISEDGLILTNAHVATPDFEVDEIVVAITESADAPPEPTYHAEVIASDLVLDLAVIQAVRTLDGDPYPDGAIPFMPVGDSDAVGIGDDLLIFGYPAIGGETITFTRGLVSGFTSDQVLGDRAWIKTDATIAGGNSGGTAANLAGELIGVPTQASAGTDLDPVDCRPMRDTDRDGDIDDEDDCVPIGGFLNGVRPINLATDMIAAVESGVAYEPIGGNAEVPSDFDVTAVIFGTPQFDEDVPESGPPENDLVWLGSGATDLCAWWTYEGMADGVTWDAIWAHDGEIQEDISYLAGVWNGGATGDWWVCFNSEEPIEEGIWDLTLNVQDELITGGFVAIGDDLEPIPFDIVNGSAADTICYVFVTPTVSPFWGGDWLGSEQVLDPGASQSIPLPPTTYDIRLDDCPHNILVEDEFTVPDVAEYVYE